MRPVKIYVAGKVSKNSYFGTHHWRDDFIATLQDLSRVELISLDPVKSGVDQSNPELVFGCDAYMISQSDVMVVYLSDDISVGGSQEILLAKYFEKPVIGLAPLGGKFNGSTKESYGRVIEDYHDPFVFTTCDVVCGSVEEVAEALVSLENIKPRGIDIIQELTDRFEQESLSSSEYLRGLVTE